MPHDLSLNDLLSRFLLYRKYINEEKGVLNSAVFSEKHPDGFSVFKTTLLPNDAIWALALAHVVVPDSGRPLLGRCDLEAVHYENAGLSIDKSEPPPLHYNIFGMPVTTDLEEASKLSKRLVMLAKAKFVRYSPPSNAN